MIRNLLLLGLSLFCAVSPPRLRADDVPVAPISPVKNGAGESLFVLRSEKLELRISPDHGSLLSIRLPDGGNILPQALTLLPPGLDAPPESSPWESRGWKNSDGGQVVMLSRRLAAPLSLSVNHVLQLSPAGARLTLTTRITALAPSDTRPLPLLAGIPLPADLPVWLRDASDDACAGWAPRDLPFASDTPALAYALGQTLAVWRWRQSTESSPQPLPATLNVRPSPDEAPFAVFASATPELPPQGWTLVSELRLDLLPLPENDSPCRLLEVLPPDVRN